MENIDACKISISYLILKVYILSKTGTKYQVNDLGAKHCQLPSFIKNIKITSVFD
jgi:hypothetical protein